MNEFKNSLVLDGALDCTHISIQNSERDQTKNLRNRKGIFSIESGPIGVKY